MLSMTNQDDIPTKKRLNITINNGAVDDIELLRAMLEKRLMQRLSIAQVIRRLTEHALIDERSLANNPDLPHKY